MIDMKKVIERIEAAMDDPEIEMVDTCPGNENYTHLIGIAKGLYGYHEINVFIMMSPEGEHS